jgi:hypothetical protein
MKRDIYSKEENGKHYLKELNQSTGNLEWVEVVTGINFNNKKEK